MHKAYGSDRVRVAGAKILLHSRYAKGWTPRVAKTLTTAEYPGTAVYWDEQYFEVIAAEAMPNGVRYVLEPWREDHVIRQFLPYDEDSEARLHADHAAAEKQRRLSVLTRISGVVLGHLPSPVQNRLANEMGVSPSQMTIISCLPAVILLGICVYLQVDAAIKQQLSPIPVWLALFAGLFFVESGVRFYVSMSQNRGMGSFLGTCLYAFGYALSGSRKETLPAPLEEPGDGTFFMIPPEEDVAIQDSLKLRGPMLTLLPAGEQDRLAKHYGFNYRDHSAFGLTWTILFFAICGVLSSWSKLHEGKPGGIVMLVIAAGLVLEQVGRLRAMRRGPAGSVLGALVRPFARDLLK